MTPSAAAARAPEEAPAPDAEVVGRPRLRPPEDQGLTPKNVVELLDKYIVGQTDAKRAVAVALRNRWRRQRLGSPLREEVVPKNILMIGPTGCGKTEIARRLAKLADAPFVKVEATKFTEVGFHGRDVDEIIRDLVEASLTLTKQRMRKRAKAQVAAAVEKQILDALCGGGADAHTRETFRRLLRSGDLDGRSVGWRSRPARVRRARAWTVASGAWPAGCPLGRWGGAPASCRATSLTCRRWWSRWTASSSGRWAWRSGA